MSESVSRNNATVKVADGVEEVVHVFIVIDDAIEALVRRLIVNGVRALLLAETDTEPDNVSVVVLDLDSASLSVSVFFLTIVNDGSRESVGDSSRVRVRMVENVALRLGDELSIRTVKERVA